MKAPVSAMEAVPLVGATATNIVTFWPRSGSVTDTVPVAGTVAVVAAVASPTDGGWFGAAPTSIETAACPQIVGETVLQTS